MSKKRKMMMRGIVGVAFVFLMAAVATNMYAKGEGGHAPEGQHMKGPALQGVLTAIYVPHRDTGLYGCDNDPYGCAVISFNVKCKNQRAVTFEIQKDLTQPIWMYTEADLDGMIFLGGGPPECASAAGGEDILVKNVTSFTNTYASDNFNGMINANLFLLYVVDYNPNNPAQ